MLTKQQMDPYIWDSTIKIKTKKGKYEQEEEDKYNMLLECNAIIQQKENIIKEVREYIVDKYYDRFLNDELEELLNDNGMKDRKQLKHILEILDKVDKENI